MENMERNAEEKWKKHEETMERIKLERSIFNYSLGMVQTNHPEWDVECLE